MFYDGTKLLSIKDIRGERPELFLCTTNRTGGKTTFFTRMLFNRFKKKGEKFAILYRYNYELCDCAKKIFKDVGPLFFPNDKLSAFPRAKGGYYELVLNEDQPCGYAISLNAADTIKKLSHLLTDTGSIFFDEFQSETHHYCDREIEKFISIHTSIARGRGKQYRYVPVYMCANPVSLINPYYVELGISSRISEKTKFLKGDGFVLEQGFVKSASDVSLASGFSRAFKNNKYIAYSAQNIYLNDNLSFISSISGKSKYLCTLKYMSKDYAVREYPSAGVVYCDDKVDASYPCKISVTLEDHSINYVMLKQYDLFINQLRWYFERGCFRFKSIPAKEAIVKAISY